MYVLQRKYQNKRNPLRKTLRSLKLSQKSPNLTMNRSATTMKKRRMKKSQLVLRSLSKMSQLKQNILKMKKMMRVTMKQPWWKTAHAYLPQAFPFKSMMTVKVLSSTQLKTVKTIDSQQTMEPRCAKHGISTSHPLVQMKKECL